MTKQASQTFPPESPAAAVAATLRSPHFLPVWASNLFQFSATFAHFLMLQWLVTSLTDSRTLIGLVPFVHGGVVFLMSPLAGVAVDRLARRPVLVACRLGMAIVITAIALLVASDRIAIWQVLVAAVVGGLLTSVMQPATQTLIFDVVERRRAPNAVSLNAAAQGVAQTLGPLFAGLLIGALGFVAAYLSAGGVFALAAALLALVPIFGRSEHAEQRQGWLRDLREGLAYVRAHPPVLLALLATTMSVFNGAVSGMRPVFARHVLQVDSTGYGVMAAAAGLGGLVAAAVMAGLRSPRRPGTMMVWSMLGYSIGIFLYAFAFSYTYVLAIEFAMGIFGQIWYVSTFSGLQLAVPPQMRGRVVSLVFMLVMLAPVGALFVGMLADAVGDKLALGIFGLMPMIVLCGILLFGSRQLRAL
jgi:predicted MFS family arabinose efflux permease